jgi:hypothetical protein
MEAAPSSPVQRVQAPSHSRHATSTRDPLVSALGVANMPAQAGVTGCHACGPHGSSDDGRRSTGIGGGCLSQDGSEGGQLWPARIGTRVVHESGQSAQGGVRAPRVVVEGSPDENGDVLHEAGAVFRNQMSTGLELGKPMRRPWSRR